MPRLEATVLVTALLLGGCALAGPASLANGRAVYNEVINETEDEQILGMIVRERYGETFGMLAVSSVTASISTGTKAVGNLGIGPDRNYDGNLVPLSLGFAYEENPTISYVPLGGEVFLRSAIAPVSLEHTFLMSRASEDRISMFGFLVRRINGLGEPADGRAGRSPAYETLVRAHRELHTAGAFHFLRSESGGEYIASLRDYAGHEDAVRSFIEAAGLRERPVDGQPIQIPVRTAIGSDPDHLNVETRSVLDLIRRVGYRIDVPQEHLAEGIVEPSPPRLGADPAFVQIHSSPEYPEHATVAVPFRDHWFYIDARDTHSKRGFVMMRTLIGIRLSDASTPDRAPALTIPVSR